MSIKAGASVLEASAATVGLHVSAGRLGSADVGEQVRQAIAHVTLEGLRPSRQSISLARSVAAGEMDTEKAIIQLRGYHGRRT
jgi:predicted thioesterase